MLKYIQWYHDDFVNGEGIREVLFVPGCNHKCKGCFNPESWNFDQGKEFTDEDYAKLLNRLRQPWCTGVTFTGGDPLYSAKAVASICHRLKRDCPDTDIWVYTGFNLSTVVKEFAPLFEGTVSTFVTEPFDETKKSPDLPWVGSSNQILYKPCRKLSSE